MMVKHGQRLWPGEIEAKAQPQYRQWTLAEIVNSLIVAGLRVERLEEYGEPFWDQFPNLPPQTLRLLPHSFALLASK